MKASPLLLLLIALPVHADTGLWLDAYGGNVVHDSASLSLNQDLLFGPDTAESLDFDPDLSPLLGLRLRGELAQWPVGVGIDLGHTRVNHPQADLTLVPIAMGVTLASRLALAQSPQLGSLHPTGMLGIVATAVDGSANIGTINSEVTDNTWGGGNGRVGLHASLGLSWQPRPGFAVFTEYRYQQMRFHLEHTNDVVLATQYLQTSGHVTAESVVLGVSFRLAQEPARAAASAPDPAPAPAPEPAPEPAAMAPAPAGAAPAPAP